MAVIAQLAQLHAVVANHDCGSHWLCVILVIDATSALSGCDSQDI
jgi:hypothetical protein